ncbi:MAG: translocation/assembly module TamB domain-containing protein [Pseudomonadota bacterium]
MRRLLPLLICLALLAPIPVAAQFLDLKNSLVQFMLDQISVPGELEITAEGVEEPTDGVTDIVGVAVADGSGVWLRVERISLRWNASRILRGELEITRLAAEGVEVLRQPDPAGVDVELKEDSAFAEDDGDPFDWPRSPVPVRIEEMALLRVAVAPGVIAEQALNFDATGSAQDEDDNQQVTLALDRTDAIPGRIRVEAARDFAADTLALLVDAEEGAGGLVAELAGLPNESASRVLLRAEGPLSDWSVSFDAATDEVFAAEGQATIATDPPLMVDAGLAITPGPRLDPQITALLGERATLDVRLQEDAGVIVVEEGRLEAPDLSVSGRGSVVRGTFESDLALELEAGGALAAIVDGLAFERIGFAGQVSGVPDDLSASGRFDLAGLQTAPVDVASASLDAAVRVAGARIEIDGSGLADGLRLDQLPPPAVGQAELTLDAVLEGERAVLETLALASPLLTVGASGEASLADGPVSLSYTIEAPDLAPIAAAYQAEAAGRFRAEGAVSGTAADAQLDGDLSLLEAQVNGVDYGEVVLRHEIALQGPEISGRIDGSASGSPLGPGSLAGAFRLRDQILDLSGFEAALLGTAIAGDATIELEQPQVVGTVNLDIPDMASLAPALEAFEMGVEPAGMAGRIAGRAVLSVDEGAQNALFDLTIAEVAMMDMALGGGRVEARLTDLLGAPGGEATLDVDDVAAFGATLAALDGDVALSGVGEAARLDVDVRAANARQGTVSLGSASLAGHVDAALSPAPALALGLEAGDIALGAARLDGVALDLDGPLSALVAALSLSGEALGDPLSLAMEATADVADPAAGAITVASLGGQIGEDRFRLTQPLVVETGAETVVRDLALALPGGRMTGDLTVHDSGLSGTAALVLDEPALLRRRASLPLASGRLQADARFDTRPGSAGATVDLTGRELRVMDVDASLGALALDVAGRWDGQRLGLTAEAQGNFGEPVRAAFALPLAPGLPPSVPAGAAIDGSVEWQGDLGAIWPFVPVPDHLLAGDVNVDLAVAGRLDAPRISGRADLSNGSYQNLETGTILQDLAATTRIDGDGALDVDLSATDGAAAEITGRVSLAGTEVDARIQTQNAVLVRRDDVTAEITADIAATGPLTGPTVAGTVRIDRAEVRLVNAVPPSVADIGPVIFRGEEPPAEGDAAGEAITLALNITAPGNLFVRGRGLDSEWGLDLAIWGTAADPRITGAIEAVRGTLSLVGRGFDLAPGRILFGGGGQIDPRLDIRLLRENEGVTGGIAVDGFASSPEISFVSTPTLPEAEVLPRVLFGRSQQSLSPAEAAQLAVGLATLLDGGGGGAFGTVRDTLGIDTLGIDTTEEGSATLSAGRNVTENVFVGVNQPIDGGAPSVEVEIEVFESESAGRFTVESEVGQDAGSNLGLRWRLDF